MAALPVVAIEPAVSPTCGGCKADESATTTLYPQGAGRGCKADESATTTLHPHRWCAGLSGMRCEPVPPFHPVTLVRKQTTSRVPGHGGGSAGSAGSTRKTSGPARLAPWYSSDLRTAYSRAPTNGEAFIGAGRLSKEVSWPNRTTSTRSASGIWRKSRNKRKSGVRNWPASTRLTVETTRPRRMPKTRPIQARRTETRRPPDTDCGGRGTRNGLAGPTKKEPRGLRFCLPVLRLISCWRSCPG